jgi:hypothetical protein
MEVTQVNASQAARLVEVNEVTIRRHIRDGSLRARKIPGSWRINLTDLRDRYEHTAAPTTRPLSLEFRYGGEAARWLAEHGVSASTARHWPEWRAVALTRQAILTLAVKLQDRCDPRRTWRLRRCDDKSCVCQTML